MKKLPIVSVEEMVRIEKESIAAGADEKQYIANVGLCIAQVVEEYLIAPTSLHTISLLVGKGFNGADALSAGNVLLDKGFTVVIHAAYPLEQMHPLTKHLYQKLQSKGALLSNQLSFSQGILIDGLIGTGFHGRIEGRLAEIIEAANASTLPIFAVDTPSGLNCNTGAVGTVAIRAHTTICLGFAKIGYFLAEAPPYIGKLVHADFGIEKKFIEQANPVAYLLSKKSSVLPPIKRDRHKYEAGYVLAVAGSKGMFGAALLACLATLRAGAGIVRLFYAKECREELAMSFYELIKEELDFTQPTRVLEEEKRAKALLLGPGLGRASATQEMVVNLLAKTTLPTILDADALYFLAENKTLTLPEKVLLTPHRKEMERILNAPPTMENCSEFARQHNATVVLKGLPTMIFSPQSLPLVVMHGDPGMATAGTGDVLTGVLAALVAQGQSLLQAAVTGVILHALSGEIAAKKYTSYAMMASDVINCLPDAWHELIFKEKI